MTARQVALASCTLVATLSFMGIFSVILLLLFFSSVVISLSGKKENLAIAVFCCLFWSCPDVMLQEDLWPWPLTAQQQPLASRGHMEEEVAWKSLRGPTRYVVIAQRL